MEHSTAASSIDVNDNYHMYKELSQCNSTAAGGLFHSNVHGFSMCASQDRPAPHFCAGVCTIEPFQREGCDTIVSRRIRDSSSSLHEPTIVLDNSNYETMQAHVLPEALAPLEYTSPEALLDVILLAQKKLQQLQAIAEFMVQVGGQAQQQQSLVASVKSLMSQLFAATAGLRAQPAPCLKHNLGHSSQLNQGSSAQLNQALGRRFDGFHSNGMNPPPLGSFVGAPHEGFFPSSNTSPCPKLTHSTMELVRMRSVGVTQPSALTDPELTRSATELVCMRGVDVSKLSGIKDRQLKEQGLNSSLGDPANHLRHSNTSNMLVESDFSHESPNIAAETCDSLCTDGNGNQEMFCLEDHDYASVFRDDDDEGEAENLPPGSYELVEMAAAEILAEHTHFCEICGKGFKRDANLRMHMRGHGDEYKTPAALARPDKSLRSSSMVKLRRYSCPYVGCKRNKKHRKFQPLKTTLCVKNHYRRSHCPKLLICSKCKTKKFSVVADLKTHEKHCGQEKWQCSCGTTFSRKDKLLGHVNLFSGHTPAVPIHEMESLNEPLLSSLPTRGGEGLEGISTSNASYLGTLDSFSAPLENGPMLITALMGESDDGIDIPDLTIMGKEVLMSDKNGQQHPVHPAEKSYLVENSERGAMEAVQHCD